MNILQEYAITRKVEYFGLTLTVPNDCEYIATDKSGKVYAYTNRPEDRHSTWATYADYVYIADVDLEGMDWRDTLQKVPQ